MRRILATLKEDPLRCLLWTGLTMMLVAACLYVWLAVTLAVMAGA